MEKMCNSEFRPTEIRIGNTVIGGGNLTVIAGPCAVETREQILCAAAGIKESGAVFLRGGAFKPRTSPHSFQGLGVEGLKLLGEAKKKAGLFLVTEIIDKSDFEIVNRYADIFQVGSRNMQNYSLLKRLGRTDKPVLLKRGYMSTIEEWLLAAEYITFYGNPNVILCERGIRTFDSATRFTLDLSAVAYIKSMVGLPVLVDPSHGTGNRELIAPLAKAALFAGADGLIIEVHPDPDNAWCDGKQSIGLDQFSRLMADIREIGNFLGKTCNI